MQEAGLIFTVTLGLSTAVVCGYITQRIGLSPIVGYLLAGIAVGPYTPGLFADVQMARQLAEIGIILLMFGVGLNFRLKDLSAVKSIAIPGAILLSASVTFCTAMLALQFGWKLESGIVLGLALSVSSTVVLTRVAQDNNVLNTAQGHIAVGWTVMEDIITVLVLVMLPELSSLLRGTVSDMDRLAYSLALSLGKIAAFVVLLFIAGSWFIPWLLTSVARVRSRELFTLSVLTVALVIAVAASSLFGTSIALGAFLAGVVVGQSNVSHQAAADALPLRDAFAVLFFVSAGMLFDPRYVLQNPVVIVSMLGIIVILRPFIAAVITCAYGHTVRIILSVSFLLAQAGEFSFIMAQLSESLGLLSSEGYTTVVACSLFSIALNPVLFRAVAPLSMRLKSPGRALAFMNDKSGRQKPLPASLQNEGQPRAIVIGYGPVGRTVTRILKDFGIQPLIVELNINTVNQLVASGIPAVYGDASMRKILLAAGIQQTDYLLITLPDLTSRIPIIAEARDINPDIKIFVRARYLAERSMLEEVGAGAVCYEETEAAVSLAALLLQEVGADPDRIQDEAEQIRKEWSLRKGLFKL